MSRKGAWSYHLPQYRLICANVLKGIFNQKAAFVKGTLLTPHRWFSPWKPHVEASAVDGGSQGPVLAGPTMLHWVTSDKSPLLLRPTCLHPESLGS